MSERFDLLAQQLLNRPTVAACSLEETARLAERYPYFGPAQFLHLRKLRDEGNDDYGRWLQKAVLHYPDPLAFEYFLNADSLSASWLPIVPQADPAEPEVEEPFREEEGETVPREVAAEAPTGLQAEGGDADLQVAAVAGSMGAGDSPIPALSISPLPASGLTFEPFHTVDYFASQGIRLSLEEQPKDRFGKQLKSFTEWLRSMKKLPAVEVGGAVDPGSEKKVERLAEGSVHGSDVVTETMAEVWLKQGNKAKALEVYEKLSLLNPAKRAYFAAKIEPLKRS